MSRILIVGAGTTGLSAALALRHHGLRPRIVDKRAAPSSLSRAVGILPSSMALFDRLDIGKRIRDRAVVIETLDVFWDGRKMLNLRLDLDPDPDVRLLSLPQDVTEAILAESLSEHGIDIEYNTPCDGLDNPDGPVEVTLDGQQETFDEVLGADGGRSTVRQALGIDQPGIELDGLWSIADLDLSEPFGPRAEVHMKGPDDVVFIIAMEEARVRLVSNTPDALATLGERLPVAGVRRTGTFHIAVRQVDNYRLGRVSLAGDAAHLHSPVGGRGMNLGIADAAEWADRLVAGTLDKYAASRHAAGAHTIGVSEGGRKALLGGGTRRSLAVSFLRVASRIPPLARRAAQRFILA